MFYQAKPFDGWFLWLDLNFVLDFVSPLGYDEITKNIGPMGLIE